MLIAAHAGQLCRCVQWDCMPMQPGPAAQFFVLDTLFISKLRLCTGWLLASASLMPCLPLQSPLMPLRPDDNLLEAELAPVCFVCANPLCQLLRPIQPPGHPSNPKPYLFLPAP